MCMMDNGRLGIMKAEDIIKNIKLTKEKTEELLILLQVIEL